MRGLLQCGVRLCCVVLAIASITSHANEALSLYPGVSLEKFYADRPLVRIESMPIMSVLPATKARQNLRLDCEKIGQAQKSLRDARDRGARMVPATPADTAASVPPTRDEVYHISRNEERFAGLVQQFQCARR